MGKEKTFPDSSRKPRWPLFPWLSKGKHLMSCEICGCLVVDEYRHYRWHRL